MKFCEKIDLDKFEIIGLSRKKDNPNSFGINWINGTIENLPELPEFDILIHAAAITHTLLEKDYLNVNFEGTKNIVNAAICSKAKKVIFISSRTASLDAGGYGKSKFLAEKYLQKTCTDWLIFRPSEIYGGLKNEGIEKLILDVLTKKIVVYPAGKSEMYPIALEDTINLMSKFIFEENSKNQVIILNGPIGFTYKSAVDFISNIGKTKPLTIPIPKFAMYLIKYVLTILKLKIGIVPDQIDRFYCEKETQKLNFPFSDFKEYILKVKANLSKT